MSVTVLALVVVVLLLVMIAIEVPIGIALTLSGALGIWLYNGDEAFSALQSAPYSSSAKYALVVIPMFVLLGALVSHAGIADRIFTAAHLVFGRLAGGLAAATVMATAMFSGISGSSAADVAAFGRVATMQMSRKGYSKEYAASVVAAAGTFAVLIPPSVAMVMYALLANVSVGAILLAGIVPGIAACVILAGFVIFQGYRKEGKLFRREQEPVLVVALESAGKVGESADIVTTKSSDSSMSALTGSGSTDGGSVVREALSGVLIAGILFGLVMGGLYSGIFTATESAAVGSAGALILGVLMVRFRAARTFKFLRAALHETVATTSMIFLLLVGGAVFSYFTSTTGIARSVADWATGLPVPPTVVVAAMLLVLLLMGTIMDGLTIMLLAVPVMAPVVMELGFDGIWFGIMVLKCVEIGLITPPVGLNVFIISGVVPGVKAQNVFKYVTPFVILDLVITALFFALPELSLWLPRTAGLL